ncbi:FIMAH domain-containing protein [Metabacillus bambusae]
MGILTEKVIKLIESYIQLLDHQLENDHISRGLYHTLKANTDSLIKRLR